MTQSMEEIVKEELEQCKHQNPDISERSLYVGFLNNFPTYLPNTKYKSSPMDVLEGRVSHEKFKKDVGVAIRESIWSKLGVDSEAFRARREQLLAYVNFLCHLGVGEGTAHLHQEFIYPIYDRLREKGYTHSGLCS